MWKYGLLFSLFSLAFFTQSPRLLAAESEDHLKILGNEAYRQKDFEKAIALYSESLKHKPSEVCLRNRGIAYVALKKYKEAQKDFAALLVVNPSDGKSHYWLGRINLERKEIAQAIYYLEDALKYNPNDPTIKSLLTQAKKQFDDSLQLLLNYRKSPGDKFYLDKISNNLLIAAEKLGIKTMAHCGLFCAKARLVHGDVPRLLEHLYLAKKFKHVCAYDISIPQVSFQNDMRRAMQGGTLKNFVAKAKSDFASFAKNKSSSQDIEKNIDYIFRKIYEPLYDKYYANISLKNQDIFEAINNENSDNTHDVVFLSTIPMLTFKDWPNQYRIIRSWLENGKTIVFSVLVDAFIDASIYQELLFGFDELAKRHAIMFEESAPMIHVKLIPKQ